MNNSQEIILAGFGGQGIMFAGKLIASAGMLAGKEVSWLPSYGPEMRGGTANCHVIVSDQQVGSPIINNPTTLIVMNRPSLDKFENTVTSGGIIIIDSSLVNRSIARTDVKGIEVPATQMAVDMGEGKLANMVLVGKFIKETGIISMDILKEALKKVVSARKQELLDINIKALELGYNY
ncbi:MAG: 2-oxoglutarate ferredoxin oxidoreductase subunit gamma [Petroclostridium sp.]|jgi:2-oxoglutarate ferredoxin oxidoreductase subunit gamma|uniref:2-oxoacid:acceptor oxidoreductase family protein n=1 Tax=Petroclostridium xylanilyticum TaxID=1792311 RepID=UPI000B9920EC|nr:2-oxoacid:acceptor oxidoreductase family protein [Petroclostridium xylanilyticum]MBZ4644761.1 2-oxoacid:ferredoxin oxidoreductase subunit gamma [Clostridia bacterium]MDK2810328.1 2-oxoglutarate ferredoxin oxidoreductase subunit gamma [Petroclostridium sp.]